MNTPRYSGPNRTGMCICGHSWDHHHLGVVVRKEYVDETNESYVPQECEHYGHNEFGGLDAHGNTHCFGYMDTKEWETLKGNSQTGV